MNKAAVAGVGVVVLTGAAYLGTTAWSGRRIEDRYHEQIARTQTRFPFLRVAEEKYAKGFFSSTASTTLQFGCPAPAGAQPVAVTVTSTIHHGPIAGATLAAAVIDTQLGVSGGPELRRAIAAFGGAPLQMHTVVGFAGNASSRFESPAARWPIGQGGAMNWQGLTGSLEASRDGRSVSYRAQSPGLTIDEPTTHATMRIGALAFHGVGMATSDAGLIVVGKSEGTLDAIEIADGRSAEPLKVLFTGLSFATETSINDGLVSGVGRFSGAGAVGDVRIDRFDLETSMQRIHAPTYEHMMATATKEIYRCDSPDKMADLLGLQDKIKDDLIALLRYSPAMAVDRLAIQSGGQTGEISYGLGIDGVSAADSQLAPAQLLMTHANAKASARLPIEWLRKISEVGASRLQGKPADPAAFDLMLEQARAQGWLLRDSEYVKSSVAFANGVLKVNGKVLGPTPPKSR